ncbi:hypothetical protein AB0D19_42480, partial [Streptomyces sp. NPDC048489]
PTVVLNAPDAELSPEEAAEPVPDLRELCGIGARIHEQHRRTDVYWQRAPQGRTGPVKVDTVHAVIGASGKGVSVEVSGRHEGIAAMLAAYAQQ